MKLRFFKTVIWMFASAGLLFAGYLFHENYGLRTAQAVGGLIIDWGVPAGDPIFTEADIAPGHVASKDTIVTNADVVPRDVGVRGVVNMETGLASSLGIIILADGAPVYGAGSSTGAKTLADFFIDSDPGIELLSLSASDSVVLNFQVGFVETAGNATQAKNVNFDLTLGFVGDALAVPAECSDIVFSGQPIIGTAGRDSLRGTEGNDLIFGLEGDDSIRGRGGDDCIVGGAGQDSLRGNDGFDVLLGGAGNDSLRGGGGNDKLLGGDDNDSLRGQSGDDELLGGSGIDAARGGSGVDTCDAEVESSCEL